MCLNFYNILSFEGAHSESLLFFFNSINFDSRFETKRYSASQQRPFDFSRRVLAIDGMFFYPTSIFGQVMANQRRYFGDFSWKPKFFFNLEPILAIL